LLNFTVLSNASFLPSSTFIAMLRTNILHSKLLLVFLFYKSILESLEVITLDTKCNFLMIMNLFDLLQ
jgi:hypothetical protein